MLKQETKDIQENLADFCRTNEKRELTGVREDRLHHYRRLIYNIIDDAIASAYPIARKQFDDVQWEEMMNEFIIEHPCANNQLFRMPGEFIEFALSKEYAKKYAIPFLIDLLLFEWAEVEVHTMPDISFPALETKVHLTNDVLYLNPYIKLLNLNYPIHLLKQQDVLKEENCYMLVYREENGTVQYMQLSTILFSIISAITEHKLSIIDLLHGELESLNEQQRTEILEGISNSFEDLQNKGVVLGTEK